MMRGFFSSFLTGLALLALTGCVLKAKQTEPEGKGVRNLRLSYDFALKIPSGSKKVAIWVPLPRSDEHQRLEDFKVTSPLPYTLYTDPDYGNTLLKLEGAGRPAESLRIRLELEVNRAAWMAGSGEGLRSPAFSKSRLRRYLKPDRLVPIDGRIAEEARRVVKNELSPLVKAKAIYDYVVKTMVYDKSGSGWGRGDALYACDARRGNCTDFHSLFIGMARASGIPARFVMGFSIPTGKEGEIPGYHCWAEFYVEDLGWIPVDASEAWKHPDKKEFFFGNLDANRVAFTLGRDISLDAHVEPLNYLIYPFVLVDGRLHQEVRTSVRFAERLN
jgi:transglutaminase-like putative cysteine protease